MSNYFCLKAIYIDFALRISTQNLIIENEEKITYISCKETEMTFSGMQPSVLRLTNEVTRNSKLNIVGFNLN